MNDYFCSLFNKEPFEIIDNDYYFDTNKNGDNFDESDVELWLNKGVFERAWKKAQNDDMFSIFAPDILNAFSTTPASFLEISCGPGMGLAPILLSKYPQTPCLVSDASSLLIKSWKKYLNNNLQQCNINLASFNTLDMPIKNNSFDIVTSFIGISSTREGENGEVQALNEIFRVLKSGGCLIAIENEWIDFDAIRRVFELWNQPIWNGLIKRKTWHRKFTEAGFIIESCDKIFLRNLSKNDNDLGAKADRFGITIKLKFTLFILRKPVI